MRLLLLSNSRNPGQEYLAHARDYLHDFLHGAGRAAFVPHAAVTLGHPDYTSRMPEALEPLGVSIESVADGDAKRRIDAADVLVVGGGNTHALLARVRAAGLLEMLRDRAQQGMPYVGWSAGSNQSRRVGPDSLSDQPALHRRADSEPRG